MPLRSSLIFCLAAMSVVVSSAVAANEMQFLVKKVDASSFPSAIVAEKRSPATTGLPDGLVATFEGTGDIATAWYTRPTERYGHAILGDGIEAGGLMIKLASGKTMEMVLPKATVFEDRYPRLVDLDNDGKVDVVTILAALAGGGSVTVFTLGKSELELKGSTGFIGRPNRWLNVAGIADYRGSGSKQIAFVKTPHIGGTLYFYEMIGNKLKRVAGLHGFSNHVIGSPEMRLSATVDVNGDGRPDLAVPSANRRKLRVVGFQGKELVEFGSAKLPARVDKAIALKLKDGRVSFVVGLDNGGVYEVSPR